MRKSPPTDARGLRGLAVTVLLPDFMGATLAVLFATVGDFAIDTEADPEDGNFDGVALERKFTLLLAFRGALSAFVATGLVPGISLAKEGVRGLKVLVEARKSSGTASPL